MTQAPLGPAWIEAHLPHRGAMMLLDAIIAWDSTTLHAVASSHRVPGNPLRRGGELPIAAGIEYGAQAAAAHGALSSGGPSGDGFLASVRAVEFHRRRLDDAGEILDVHAEQLGVGESGVIYRFHLSAGGIALVEGRVAVAFRP